MPTRHEAGHSNKKVRNSVVIAILLLSLSGHAQIELPETTDDLQYGVKAKRTSSVAPRYPYNELKRGLEGWVLLNFVVGTDGTISDPVVEDSSGSRYFESAALEVVSKWRYSPATWNGEAVEQCHTNVRVTFSIDGDSARGATPRFLRRFGKFNELLSAGKLGEADTLVEKVFQHEKLNLYEMSVAWLMRSSLAAKRGDRAGQLEALRKASVSQGDWMEPDRYQAVLRSMFWLEVETEQFSGALATYRQLQKDPEGLSDEVKSVAEQIIAQIDGPAVFGRKAVIENDFAVEDAPYWRHEALRRTVGIQDIDGSIDKLEIRCDWNRATDTVSDGKVWTIPDSWGGCRILVFGEEGASFLFVEYPNEQET